MKITTELLRKKKACEEQVVIFEKEWPNGIEITLESLDKALELELDIDEFANIFLTDLRLKTYIKKYGQAWVTYLEATAQAQKIFNETVALTLLNTIEEEVKKTL